MNKPSNHARGIARTFGPVVLSTALAIATGLAPRAASAHGDQPHEEPARFLRYSDGAMRNYLPMSVIDGGPIVPNHKQIDLPPTQAEEQRVLKIAQEQRIGQRSAQDALAIAGNEHLVGRWDGPHDWPLVAIHATLMANGKVLAFDSVGANATETYTQHNFTRATVWDPVLNSHTAVTVTTGFNLFCAGPINLTDGRVFLAGGNADQFLNGLNKTHVFDPAGNTWSVERTMASGRWYPSVTALRDGDVLITGGGPSLPEVRASNGDLRTLPGANTNVADDRIYHWLKAAPNGKVVYLGPDKHLRWLDTTGSGAWSAAGQRDALYRGYGSYAMYDIGRFLIAGGAQPATNSAVIADVNGPQPSVQNTNPMAHARRQHNLTVLADGTVLATGGFDSAEERVDLVHPVYAAEQWNPATGAWRTLASMTVTRQYHSIALLLPDARVLVAGGGVCGECTANNYLAKDAEIFTPPYLFNPDGSGALAARPVISSTPSSLAHGASFAIGTGNAASIGKVSLVRLGSATHSVDMDQRYIPLSFSAGANSLQVVAPASSSVAPPGPYMLFIVDSNGVPSTASIVFLNGVTAAPTPIPTSTPEPGPQNLALRKPASSSDQCQPWEGPEKAVNGSWSLGRIDKWCSTGNGSTLVIDLGATYNVARYVIHHAGSGGEFSSANTRDFVLQTSLDATSWLTHVVVTGNTADVTTHDASAQPARYVRLRIDVPVTSGEVAGRIYEVEVYDGVPVPTATPTTIFIPTATPTPSATPTRTPTPSATPTLAPSATAQPSPTGIAGRVYLPVMVKAMQ